MEEWSKEPPKEDGFYWVCEPEYTQPEVVRLARPWVYYGGSMEPMPRAVQDIPAWGPKVEIPPMVAKGIFPVFPPFEESETKEVNTCSECGEVSEREFCSEDCQDKWHKRRERIERESEKSQ